MGWTAGELQERFTSRAAITFISARTSPLAS